MSIAPPRGADRLVRSAFGSIAATILLVVLAVLPVAAVSGPTKLIDPTVGPATGTTATTFTFEVTYRNREGSEPDYVRVVVDGVAHAMSGTGDSWKSGVRFSWASKLSIGTHEVAFEAMDRDKFTDGIDGGTVTVAAPVSPTPAPTPTPTPTPTPPTPTPTPPPTPTPQPTPEPTPVPTPVPTEPGPATPEPTDPSDPHDPAFLSGGSSAPGGGTGGSDPGGPTPGGGSSGGSTGGSPTGGSSTGGSTSGGSTGSTGGETGGSSTGGSTSPSGGDTGSGGFGSGPGWGELLAAIDSLGLTSTSSSAFGLVPVMVTTTGGVAMAMAFMFFGKRRRDGEPPAPDEVLSAAAARGTGHAATAALVPEVVVPPVPVDPDLLMPRWRRPSLLEARKADPLRNGVVIERMSFDHGLVGAVDGHERRTIRYQIVRLLDAPDELRGAEIGELLSGDEVQLIEKSGTYWLVLCPDGRQGWIHKMTLGDVVGEPPAPSAQDTWGNGTDEADEVDDDVLTAFMAARGRS